MDSKPQGQRVFTEKLLDQADGKWSSCRVRETELQLPEWVLLLAMPESREWGLQGWGMLSPEQGVGALSCRPGWKALASVTRGGMKEAAPGARAFENRGGRQGGPPRA